MKLYLLIVAIFAMVILGATNNRLCAEDSSFTPPSRPPQSRYASVWGNSPFELDAAPTITQTKEVPRNDYVLAGVMKRGQAYVVYVQNRKTKEVVKVTKGEPSSGFVLKEVMKSDSNEFIAKVERQGQLLSLKYDRMRTTIANRQPPNLRPPTPAKINPAQAALERARQKAAAAQAQSKEGTKKLPTRRRTIFTPK